ncbi:MAG: PQQ-binding-like beta-propeller repeat protein [Verrucomicrobiae bacterium]|nr:PQQ-binding-like beta-propeller repeat protein [Verrucomicrobiae bacterium]
MATNSLSGTLTLLWTFRTGGPIKSSPAVVGDRVFIGSDDGRVYALSVKNGQLLWAFATSNAVEAAPLVLEGAVFIGSTDGQFYALDAATGALKWRYATEGKIVGAANYFRSGGALRLLVGSHDNLLHCVDAATGKVLWTFDTSNYVNGSAAVADGRIVFGGCDAVLHVLDFVGKELAAIEVGA